MVSAEPFSSMTSGGMILAHVATACHTRDHFTRPHSQRRYCSRCRSGGAVGSAVDIRRACFLGRGPGSVGGAGVVSALLASAHSVSAGRAVFSSLPVVSEASGSSPRSVCRHLQKLVIAMQAIRARLSPCPKRSLVPGLRSALGVLLGLGQTTLGRDLPALDHIVPVKLVC